LKCLNLVVHRLCGKVCGKLEICGKKRANYTFPKFPQAEVFNSLWKSGKHYLIIAAKQLNIIQLKILLVEKIHFFLVKRVLINCKDYLLNR